MNGELSPERVKRIAHIKSHLDGGFKLDQLVRNIENGLGNPRACVMSLSRHAEASGFYAWFEERDLTSMRQWFHTAAKLDRKWYQMEEDKQGSGSKMLELIKPLVSNDRSLIEWFAHYDQVYYLDRVEEQTTHDFWAYQAIVALRGEWPRLIERCERVMRTPPRAASEQKYLPDHEFYLALARRDVGTMTEALHKLVTPKMVKVRNNDDIGYARDLISTAAVIYAKIAWFHGYEVRVDSPYIPSEWLPMEPLQRYDDRYGFIWSEATERAWRSADMSTQPKIDPPLLQARSNRLKRLLEAYSDSEPEAALCLKHLSPLFADAMANKIHTPRRSVAPCAVYFVEGRLRRHPELEEAFADFSAALQGLDDATLRALRRGEHRHT